MARKMQKMTALVLALTLTAGQVVVPALAAGTEESIVIPGENITVTTDGNTVTTKGSVTTADGTLITVEEKVTTDPATGTTSSISDTTQSNSGTGASSNSSVSTTKATENLTGGGSKNTTDTQSKWGSTNTADNTTTTTEGFQSSHHESTFDDKGRPLNESASLSGRESTTTTTTTASSSTSVQEGGEKATENGEYREISSTETDPEIKSSETKEKIIGSADISDLTTPKASITVKPGEQDKETTVDLTPEQIKKILDSNQTPLNIPEPTDHANSVTQSNSDGSISGFTYTTTTDDGKKQVVEITYIYGSEEDGLQDTIIGYKKTTKTTEGVEETPSSTTKSEYTTTVGEPDSGDGRNYQMPQRATEGTVTNEDGSITVTTVEDQKNESDELIGYKTVRTTTSADGKNTLVDTVTEYRTEINSSSNTTFTLPTKPSGGTVQNADGTTTVTTVEDIMDGGKVVGYKTTRVTTSSDGLYKYTESESIYGTTTTVDTQTTTAKREEQESSETTTTKTITTTTLIFYDAEGYQLVWNADGNQWVYKATMSQVRGDGKVSQHTLEPVYVKDLRKGGQDLETRNADTSVKSTNPPEGYDYIYKGVRSLGSQYRVEANTGGMYKAHLFQLEKLNDDGNNETFFAYCIDMGTSAQSNYYYKIENLEKASSYISEAQSKQIKAIAMNGYWGTESGLGSLEELRKKLVAAKVFTEAEAAELTDGEALTATQAALWKYGNSDTKKLQVKDSQGTGYNGTSEKNNPKAGERINKVYKWLINLNPTEDDEPTQIIDKDSFATSATIKVNNEVTAKEGDTSKKKYNTDISFTMNVKKSSLTGNLKLEIKEGDKVIKTVQIATEDTNPIGKLFADIKDTETGSTITIKDVVLGSGTKVTLTLSGAQKLKTGAYLYTSEVYNGTPSQSFVTLAEGENAVNLSVDLTLTVTEPKVQVQDPGRGRKEQVTTTQVLEKVDSSYSSASYENTYVQTTTSTHTKRSWTAELLRSWKYEEPPKEEHPKGNDKDVPLAEAPKTGDNAWLWAVVCLGSLAGAMLLGKKKERA